MKVELLKNIIKEAVREAVNEEIKAILLEAVNIASKEDTPEVKVQKPVKRSIEKADPIMEMINMTKDTMTQHDYKSMINADSSMVPRPDFQMNSIAENFQPGPQPGIDISKLDFVKNAAAIFNRSVEIQKGN